MLIELEPVCFTFGDINSHYAVYNSRNNYSILLYLNSPKNFVTNSLMITVPKHTLVDLLLGKQSFAQIVTNCRVSLVTQHHNIDTSDSTITKSQIKYVLEEPPETTIRKYNLNTQCIDYTKTINPDDLHYVQGLLI